MPTIDFGKVFGKGKRRANEPVWQDQSGRQYPVSQIENSHLQNIERWLRGGGATPAPEGMGKAYEIIADEMERRRLPLLVDHPNTFARVQFDLPDIEKRVDEILEQEFEDYGAFVTELKSPGNRPYLNDVYVELGKRVRNSYRKRIKKEDLQEAILALAKRKQINAELEDDLFSGDRWPDQK